MIPHSSKFPLRTQFLAFRARAKQLVTPHTRVSFLESSFSSRLSVIVPKKLSKLSVVRNSLKRLVYDTLWPQLKDKRHDVVIVFKPIALKLDAKIKEELKHELAQIVATL